MATALAACGGSTPIAHTTAPPSASAAASATAGTNASPAASPSAVATSMVHCASAVPAGDNLVIGTVVGDPTVVVRGIQGPAPARNLCILDSSAQSPLFVSGSTVPCATASDQITRADPSGG